MALRSSCRHCRDGSCWLPAQQCSSAAVQQCGRLYWALAFQSVAAISEAAITTIVLLLWVGGVIFNAVRTLYFMFIDTRSHGM